MEEDALSVLAAWDISSPSVQVVRTLAQTSKLPAALCLHWYKSGNCDRGEHLWAVKTSAVVHIIRMPFSASYDSSGMKRSAILSGKKEDSSLTKVDWELDSAPLARFDAACVCCGYSSTLDERLQAFVETLVKQERVEGEK